MKINFLKIGITGTVLSLVLYYTNALPVLFMTLDISGFANSVYNMLLPFAILFSILGFYGIYKQRKNVLKNACSNNEEDNSFVTNANRSAPVGAFVAILSCTSCFPALASFASAIGLGFLSQYAGIFLSVLLPLFATFSLIVSIFGYLNHHQIKRAIFGSIGPLIVISYFQVFKTSFPWSSAYMYTGIGIMFIYSIWDLFSPTNKRCADDGCSTDGSSVPQKG
jgi:mercuric ion transport protein